MDFMLNLFFQHSEWTFSRVHEASHHMNFVEFLSAGSLECWKSRFNMKSNFKRWFLVENLALEDNKILKLRQPENLLPNFADLYSKLLPKIWIMRKLRQSLIQKKSKFSWFTPWIQTSTFKNILVLKSESKFDLILWTVWSSNF